MTNPTLADLHAFMEVAARRSFRQATDRWVCPARH